MKIEIEIKENIFPKLFEVHDNIDQLIIFLLNIGYQNFFSSVNERNLIDSMNNTCRQFKDDIVKSFDSKNENIKDKLLLLESNIQKSNANEKLEELSKIIEKLFGISNTSSKKGQISENLIYNMLEEKFSDYSYDVKRHIAHHADGELTSPTGMKSLIEIKNYTNTVNKDEVEKFKYDLKYTKNNFGIFISLQTGIAFRKGIDYETFQDGDETYHIIYISKLMEDTNKLQSAILLIENLYKINSKDNIDLKIQQIKKIVYDNFNELESLISKTSDIRNEYVKMESVIKQNFDSFYCKLRSHETEMKAKMQKVWLNLFNDLDYIDKNYIDLNTSLLQNIPEKDKCYTILSRLFDLLSKNNIKLSEEGNKYIMMINNSLFGEVKKMKDKVQFQTLDGSIVINLKHNDSSLDSNFNLINMLIKNYK